jgi:hypothetical protein
MPRYPIALLALCLLGGAATTCSLSGLSDGERDSGVPSGGGNAGSGGGGTGGAGGSICDAGVCPDSSAGTGGGPSCTDETRNGSETDVDCGGSCPACGVDRTCKQSSDCKTKVCSQGACACPTDTTYVMPTQIPESVPYCVDLTEVTNEQYDQFLQQNPSPSAQTEPCTWNKSFTPANFAASVKAKPKHPVVNVDWCDARAFCAARGKRLCGKNGGGSHVFTLPQSGTNEWYVACSQAGTNIFVYGNTFDPDACAMKDTPDTGPDSTFEVGSHPKCKGGYGNIVDMNGNVWEWEDSCNEVDGGDASITLCRRRGGSVDDTNNCGRCAACGSAARARNNGGQTTGFRCCAG